MDWDRDDSRRQLKEEIHRDEFVRNQQRDFCGLYLRATTMVPDLGARRPVSMRAEPVEQEDRFSAVKRQGERTRDRRKKGSGGGEKQDE